MSLAIVHNTAAAAKHRHVDVREVVEELRRRHPRAGEDRLAEMLVERLEEDRHLLLDAGRFLVERILAAVETRQRQSRAAPSPEQRTARKAVEREQVKTLVEKVKAAVLDTEIGGTKLRFHTPATVSHMSTGLARIAELATERGGPDCLIGEVVCEREAVEVLGDAT
jgi:hypothetical protein